MIQVSFFVEILFKSIFLDYSKVFLMPQDFDLADSKPGEFFVVNGFLLKFSVFWKIYIRKCYKKDIFDEFGY